MKIFCIFGLLFLASCGETTIPDFSPCQLMTFSDALPVQFWLSDCDTYNETVPKGVHEACFCHPWQCDDQIRIQFQEDNSPDEDYFLLAIDEDDDLLAVLDFDEIDSGIHSAMFSPETEGICNTNIQLLIANLGDEIFDNPNFDSTLSPWESVTGSGEDWSWEDPGGRANLTIDAGNTISDPLRQDFDEMSAGFYRLQVNVATGNIEQTLTGNVYLGVVLVKEVINKTFPASTSGATDWLFDVSINSNFDRIEFVMTQESQGSSKNFSLTAASLKPFTSLAKSDCLQIATTQDETELIEYSNGRNFAGLIYSDISPDASFNIRVPCRFFHEEFPEEDEAIELTSQVVTTSSQMKSQKLLEVKHVPYYFHKKLQLILKHQTLEVGGVAYKKEERYEINKGNMKWPMKSATCLLTEKSSVLRNTL